MALKRYRKDILTRPIFAWAKKALPRMSETEREAINAGDVWWDADLFSGNPDWRKLQRTSRPTLTPDEQAFIEGPVEELCAMLDEWQITWEDGDLPPSVWEFMKAHGFFGMIVPTDYGGLGFSAFAHSEVVRKISTRSATAAVTVMVPNSLGPGELLMQFGTQEQRETWLPRLAKGEEIPCFGLTSPEAGSDAAAMVDSGVVCKGTYDGREVTGIRLNWNKRYITLAPVATVLGLAFKLYDPDGILGGEEELGITVALVPTDLDGVETGRRHLPSYQMFQNGPTRGRDVFVPLENIIGGEDQIGKGWQMLMSALAAGRGISLPSLSTAGMALTAHSTGAYARIREQFGISIGEFEGVQVRLARLAARAYQMDAARRLTCAGLDEGHSLAVVSAIMKADATYKLRASVDDAMDVHAGKAVIDGPLNYLGNLYRAVPVAITVEGANILTRNLIIFGQGAIRCHPWLLKEMLALEETDRGRALEKFDDAFWSHVSHSLATLGRAAVRSWSGGRIGTAPPDEPETERYYKQLSRYAASFALASDLALLTLGGALKRKEMLSARFADILCELYTLSAVLKRWEDEGRHEEDLPLVELCMRRGFSTIEKRLADICRNLPNRPMAWLLRSVILPFGARTRGARDTLLSRCAEYLTGPNATRERLSAGLYLGKAGEETGLALVERAFDLVIETAPIAAKLRKAKVDGIDEALETGLVSESEARDLQKARDAVNRAIQVDDFDPGAFRRARAEDEDEGALPGLAPAAQRMAVVR